MKVDSSNLAKDTEELKKLIAQYPDYPIVVLVARYACSGAYEWEYCNSICFKITEILDCTVPFNDEHTYCDREELRTNIECWLVDKDLDLKVPSEEFEEMMQKEVEKYEPYWEKVIAIYVDE